MPVNIRQQMNPGASRQTYANEYFTTADAFHFTFERHS